MKGKTKENRYSTDKAMAFTWLLLCDDLGTSECQPIRAAIARGDIRSARLLAQQLRTFDTSVSAFKRVAQVRDWCKRYRFADDLFSDADLLSASWGKYSEVQQRIARPFRTDILYHTGLVTRWRRLCKEILGSYSETEHFERCTFAKNACVGHPASRKGLDQKLKGPITGSAAHLAFLWKYAETDPTLARLLASSEFAPAPSLSLTFVPKSYKALRAIMPDTLAGSFYSSGLGEMIRLRLKSHGLNIRTLQRRHRALARRSSRVSWLGCNKSSAKRLSTIDLSSASDSITPQLLRLILPREWYTAVMRGRVSRFSFNDEALPYALMSACTMGLGHTFPLETLIFYVLTRGVAEWYGPEAVQAVSVYGDDIIATTETVCGDGKYPSLVSILQAVHLQVNLDKSFWGYCDFRESCGGDFYRGHDVRPASPQGSSETLSALPYAAFLYGLANGLLRHWSPPYIEATLSWIVLEIHSVLGTVHVVPPSFPDTSGLKVEPGTWYTEEPDRINFGSYVVQFLQSIKPGRRPLGELAYLWDNLRLRERMEVRPWSLTSYELPQFSRVVVRKIRFGKRHKHVKFLEVDDPTAACRYQVAKSICPQWV